VLYIYKQAAVENFSRLQETHN